MKHLICCILAIITCSFYAEAVWTLDELARISRNTGISPEDLPEILRLTKLTDEELGQIFLSEALTEEEKTTLSTKLKLTPDQPLEPNPNSLQAHALDCNGIRLNDEAAVVLAKALYIGCLTAEEIKRLEGLADAAGIDTRGDWEHTME